LPRIVVVTDSSALLPQDITEKYDIHVAPMHLIWDGKTYRDGIDIQPDEFFKRMRRSPSLPTTSGAIQAEFLQIFQSLRGKADAVAAIILSNDLSAAYDSARVAAELVPDLHVEMLDSRTSTIALGFAVIAAAKVAQTGVGMKEVLRAGKAVLEKVKVYVAVDTLDYLRRGGRVSLPAAVVARFLHVKPLLALRDGKAVPLARPVTTAAARKRLLRYLQQDSAGTPLHVGIMHADSPEDAELLRKDIETCFKPVEILVRSFTPIMGAHTGPGLIGIAFYNE
jgi:DegV family protein with EDD domain